MVYINGKIYAGKLCASMEISLYHVESCRICWILMLINMKIKRRNYIIVDEILKKHLKR